MGIPSPNVAPANRTGGREEMNAPVDTPELQAPAASGKKESETTRQVPILLNLHHNGRAEESPTCSSSGVRQVACGR
jgi:hypothetical protein